MVLFNFGTFPMIIKLTVYYNISYNYYYYKTSIQYYTTNQKATIQTAVYSSNHIPLQLNKTSPTQLMLTLQQRSINQPRTEQQPIIPPRTTTCRYCLMKQQFKLNSKCMQHMLQDDLQSRRAKQHLQESGSINNRTVSQLSRPLHNTPVGSQEGQLSSMSQNDQESEPQAVCDIQFVRPGVNDHKRFNSPEISINFNFDPSYPDSRRNSVIYGSRVAEELINKKQFQQIPSKAHYSISNQKQVPQKQRKTHEKVFKLYSDSLERDSHNFLDFSSTVPNRPAVRANSSPSQINRSSSSEYSAELEDDSDFSSVTLSNQSLSPGVSAKADAGEEIYKSNIPIQLEQIFQELNNFAHKISKSPQIVTQKQQSKAKNLLSMIGDQISQKMRVVEPQSRIVQEPRNVNNLFLKPIVGSSQVINGTRVSSDIKVMTSMEALPAGSVYSEMKPIKRADDLLNRSELDMSARSAQYLSLSSPNLPYIGRSQMGIKEPEHGTLLELLIVQAVAIESLLDYRTELFEEAVNDAYD